MNNKRYNKSCNLNKCFKGIMEITRHAFMGDNEAY